MTFAQLTIGQTFDWINDSTPGSNSFFHRCEKTSARKYRDLVTGQSYRVGTIKAPVFHVAA